MQNNSIFASIIVVYTAPWCTESNHMSVVAIPTATRNSSHKTMIATTTTAARMPHRSRVRRRVDRCDAALAAVCVAVASVSRRCRAGC